jgi:hypothetical protein
MKGLFLSGVCNNTEFAPAPYTQHTHAVFCLLHQRRQNWTDIQRVITLSMAIATRKTNASKPDSIHTPTHV